MSELKLPAASGGGSISIKGPASSGSDVDLLDTSGNLNITGTVGIGTTANSSYSGSSDDLVIDNGASDVGITLDSEAQCSIAFTDSTKTSWDGWVKYVHSDNHLEFGSGASERLRITSGGHVLIGDEGNDNAFFKAHAADGESDNLYVGQFINAEATAGNNYGVNIQGGSNSTDHGLRVKNHAGTVQLLVRGDGEVQIGSGDLVFGTAGKGICLGVTSNTDSNTLDDYEEGTFSPTMSGSGTAGTASYTHQTGYYRKIGDKVTIWVRLHATLSGESGDLRVGNFPFTCLNNHEATSATQYNQLETGLPANTYQVNATLTSNNNYVEFRCSKTDNSGHAYLAAQNVTWFRFNLTYLAA